MYILHKQAVRPLRAIATLVVMSLVLWTLGVLPGYNRADAANLITLSDTLSDSDVGVASNHTFSFTTPNGLMAGQTLTITFPAQFTVAGTGNTGLNFSDLDVTVNGQDITLVNSGEAAGTWSVATSTNAITLTTSTSSGSIAVASSSAMVVKIGTNATVGATGDTRITNPASVGSFELTLSTTWDSGQTRVAILDDVVVTADVNTSFTFTVSGVANGLAVNGSPTTTATTTTATSVPFGTLNAGTSKTLAQDLSVTTNAANGFVVTVEQNQNLLSSTGADIDGFSNGAYTNTPTAWTSPTNVLGTENTYGHWGITSEDNLNTDEFGTDLWVAASTTPRQVFQHNGPADGTTANIGRTRVGFQAQIASLQEAADDYTTTLTYIATPTF